MKNKTTQDAKFKGMTLDQIRYERMKALMMIEVNKAQAAATAAQIKQRASSQGVRGLLFEGLALKRLKVADYVFLGFKASQLLFKLWRKRSKL